MENLFESELFHVRVEMTRRMSINVFKIIMQKIFSMRKRLIIVVMIHSFIIICLLGLRNKKVIGIILVLWLRERDYFV